ncbi:glycerol-3-phosphate acyltransferase 3-like isoform X2 [Gordionus sp. m RMFG-2023]|uniref:glycerol-3-phosphate acyltransferase 3-like isoform X2 n=1 Tax=Gordionus sp. m RMFG-2023 TaxID=3053472 RepID=UPI0031FD8C4C
MSLAHHVFGSIVAVGLSPIILFFFLVILITSSDKSYGFRRLFVKLLLRLFEWASQIQHEKQQTHDPDDIDKDIIDHSKNNLINNGNSRSSLFHKSASAIRPNKNSFNKNYLIEKDIPTYGPQTPIAPAESLPNFQVGDNDGEEEIETENKYKPRKVSLDTIEIKQKRNHVDGRIGLTREALGADKKRAVKSPEMSNGMIPRSDKNKPIDDKVNLLPGKQTPNGVINKNGHHMPPPNYKVIKENFQIHHVLDYQRFGIEAIIEDEVTQRFQAEELPSWNLLTRTNKNFYYISPTFTILWGIGFIFRYIFLLPVRIMLFTLGIIWLMFSTAIIGMVPESDFKIWLYKHASLMCFRILARSLTAIVIFHNKDNRAKPGGICVANHTSPIDVVMLSCDNCYALIGTCINNTSVMMFKKGSFEVGGIIYPAAIKYDARFGDPFWNSSRQTFLQYLLMMMTSWALVCDVWYLPPMIIQENEDSYHFADRVKAAIAQQGGLVDLDWDGELKRAKVKKSWIDNQRFIYSQRIKTE